MEQMTRGLQEKRPTMFLRKTHHTLRNWVRRQFGYRSIEEVAMMRVADPKTALMPGLQKRLGELTSLTEGQIAAVENERRRRLKGYAPYEKLKEV